MNTSQSRSGNLTSQVDTAVNRQLKRIFQNLARCSPARLSKVSSTVLLHCSRWQRSLGELQHRRLESLVRWCDVNVTIFLRQINGKKNTRLLIAVYVVFTASMTTAFLVMWPGTIMWAEVSLLLPSVVWNIKSQRRNSFLLLILLHLPHKSHCKAHAMSMWLY